MAELTAELVADLTAPRDPHLSPDGSRVVYVLAPFSKKDEHGVSALWIAPTDGSLPPRQFTAGTAEDCQPQWSPDGSQIAFLSDRAQRGTAQLYVISADGGEARPLTAIEHKRPVISFRWSPGGGQIAYTSADEPSDQDERREKERDDAEVYGERLLHARLRLLSVATCEVTALVAGERHVAAFAWAPQGTEIAYMLWQTPALESLSREIVIERIAVAGGAPQRVCGCPRGWVGALAWPSDQMLLFEGPVGEQGQSSKAIWSVDARGGTPRRLALGEESCAGALQQPPGCARAVVEIGAGLETQLGWLEGATGALEVFYTPAAVQPDGDLAGWTVRPFDDGGLAVAVVRSSGAQPWEVWAGRAECADAGLTWRQLSTHQTSLAGIAFGRQEPFSWTAADGWELDGLLVRPPDAPPDRPLPTVVLVHGGPYWRCGLGFHLSWADWAQWLALDGYAVLMPNIRGGYGHGERFAAAARGDVGGADYRDVMAAVDAAIDRGIADPQRLGIGGWSQGGFMSAWAVTQTRRFKAAVMGAGISDMGMMAMTGDLPDFERELGGSVPWDGVGPHRHTQLSPIAFARAVTTPVLILHGQNDVRVPVSQAIGFHRALRQYGVPTEFVSYPREPHGIAERAHQIDLLRRVRSWYDRWLRP
jgi:dipeptidyl aminopeptidase/acylaminoacyl peptidase